MLEKIKYKIFIFLVHVIKINHLLDSLVIGMPANGIILFVTLFNWHKRSASSWLVLNLAFADLCLGMVKVYFQS
jgi:hypothetical protein